MKKLLPFLLALSLNGIAQPMTYIMQSSAYSVSIGDSAWVGIKVGDSYPQSLTDISRIYIHDVNGNLYEVWHDTYFNVQYVYQKYWSGTDSLYKCHFQIPACIPGLGEYYTNMNSKPVLIMSNTTGIEQYDIPKRIRTNPMNGYNLLGQKVK